RMRSWPSAWTAAIIAQRSAAAGAGPTTTLAQNGRAQMASDEVSGARVVPPVLYREDVYTDRRMGTIRVMTPVTGEGNTDLTRAILYVGETQILTSVGALPVVFDIEAKPLSKAA